jgi:hypothetical protein
MEDCEIYYIKNKHNNKYYIGKAVKTTGVMKKEWGIQGIWMSHLREANNSVDKKQKGHCVILNSALIKYGENGFEVGKICDCLSSDADELEEKYIIEYNALVPYGYNLKTGGNKGKDSDETRAKKSLAHIGKQHSTDTKSAISKGQLGNKRNMKSKFEEDSTLPKYIVCKRYGTKKIGYMVSKYPTDRKNKVYFDKEFIVGSDYKDIETCLSEAIKCLNELQKEVINEPKVKSVEKKSRVTKKGADKYNMPKYISLLSSKGEEIGFSIDGLRIVNEDGSISRYSKKFTSKSLTMEQRLSQAIECLNDVKNNKTCLLDEVCNTN